MLNVAAIAETIEAVREKCLPGRESCAVNEAMRAARKLTDNRFVERRHRRRRHRRAAAPGISTKDCSQ